jgi:hypothetical protein
MCHAIAQKGAFHASATPFSQDSNVGTINQMFSSGVNQPSVGLFPFRQVDSDPHSLSLNARELKKLLETHRESIWYACGRPLGVNTPKTKFRISRSFTLLHPSIRLDRGHQCVPENKASVNIFRVEGYLEWETALETSPV